MTFLRNAFREIRHYPSAIAGLVVVLLLILVSIYTVVTIPYEEALTLWRGGEIWHNLPRTVPPAWINVFRSKKLPENIVLDSRQDDIPREVKPLGKGQSVTLTYTFDFQADEVPSELTLFFDVDYKEKAPFADITWTTPDGREIRIMNAVVKRNATFRFGQDEKLQRRILRQIGDVPVETGLFIAPLENKKERPKEVQPLKGTYTLTITATTFEPDTRFDAEFVAYGKVYGVAGTDHMRRDLKIALLWGAPVALAFGLLAALGTTVTTMIIAAIGVWFGGVVDDVIQRVTEVNLMLPLLPILIMVGTFYSHSIWVMLGVTILLSIFGSSIKTYRAIFLQVKASPYIEAARAYGASDWRIIFRYLVPRILPVLIPSLVTLIPSYVFLEASLAVLGLGDPVLPTWGKVIQDAQANGALYKGQFYWVLEPSALLMFTGLGFAMLGFALDRIFNPRLRGM